MDKLDCKLYELDKLRMSATGYVYSGGCVTRTVGDEARQPSLLQKNKRVASGYCTGVLINTY